MLLAPQDDIVLIISLPRLISQEQSKKKFDPVHKIANHSNLVIRMGLAT